jgi:4a-hydroxytetrahydrobiopterin dehydratase
MRFKELNIDKTKLTEKKCVPCEGGVPPFNASETKEYLKKVDNWKLEGNKIHKSYHFVNFVKTMDFVNKVAELAESEGHHPDMHISYGSCKVILWTHAINGLSENDFILAAKIDRL